MELHVIVGGGRIGSTVATLLAEQGHQVRVITRSGSGPEHANVERVAADATDADRLTELTTGAAVLYNCANPEYHRWPTDWPPLAEALLTAAERTGAVLAITSALYGYGPVTGPITPATPLAATHPKLKMRADMWREALQRHEAGRIRVVEVRGSDYIEARGVLDFSLREPLLAGKRAWVPGPLDVKHTWTSTTDVARTLITVAADPSAHGEAWLVPSTPPLTLRELAVRFARVHGKPRPKLSSLPYPLMWVVGLFMPMVRELRTTRYQFTAPFVLDASATERRFGITPTAIDDALRAAVRMS